MTYDNDPDVRGWRPPPGQAPGLDPRKIGGAVLVAGCALVGYLFLPLDSWVGSLWTGMDSTPSPPMAAPHVDDRDVSQLDKHHIPKIPVRAADAALPQEAPADTSMYDLLKAQYDELHGKYQQLAGLLQGQAGQPVPSTTTTTPKGDEDAKKRAEEAKRKREAFAKSPPIFLTRKSDDAAGKLHALKSPYSLAPSEVIPCTTTMEISSDTPGAFVAIVSQDIPDTATRTKNVIPRGSKFVLRPRGKLIFGDSRMDIQTQTLTFPGGSWLKMPTNTVTDAHGTAGFTGDIDRHYLRIFGSILLTGVLRGGTTIATGGYSGDLGESIGGAVVQEGAAEGTRQAQRQMSRTDPTITVKNRYACQILLEDELVLTRAYPPSQP